MANPTQHACYRLIKNAERPSFSRIERRCGSVKSCLKDRQGLRRALSPCDGCLQMLEARIDSLLDQQRVVRVLASEH